MLTFVNLRLTFVSSSSGEMCRLSCHDKWAGTVAAVSSPAPPYGTIHCATLPPPPAHFRSVAHAASGGLLHCLVAGRCGRQAATSVQLLLSWDLLLPLNIGPHLWLTYNPPPAPCRIIFSSNAGQMHLHSAFNINYLNVNSILNFILFTA